MGNPVAIIPGNSDDRRAAGYRSCLMLITPVSPILSSATPRALRTKGEEKERGRHSAEGGACDN